MLVLLWGALRQRLAQIKWQKSSYLRMDLPEQGAKKHTVGGELSLKGLRTMERSLSDLSNEAALIYENHSSDQKYALRP